MFCLHAYMCVPYMSGVPGDHRKKLNPLELELQIILSHHVGAENQSQVLCKNIQGS